MNLSTGGTGCLIDPTSGQNLISNPALFERRSMTRLLAQAPWTKGLGTTLDADFAKCEHEPVSARHQPKAPQNVLANARSGRSASESVAPDRRARHLAVACRITADVSVSGCRSA